MIRTKIRGTVINSVNRNFVTEGSIYCDDLMETGTRSVRGKKSRLSPVISSYTVESISRIVSIRVSIIVTN